MSDLTMGSDTALGGSGGGIAARFRALGLAGAAVWPLGWRHVAPLLTKLHRRLHALRDTQRLGRTGAFDSAWYAARYPDIAGTGLDPLTHYVRKGAWEGRRPRPDFDPLHYLSLHADVAASGVEPFTHYLLAGRREGRTVAPSDPALSSLSEQRAALKQEGGPKGWHGAHPLRAAHAFARTAGAGPFADLAAPDAPTPANSVDWRARLGPVHLLEEHIATRAPAPHAAPSPAAPTFAILTVFQGERAGFARTAGWIGALLAQERRQIQAPRFRWMVINDDPACPQGDLESVLPRDVRAATDLSGGEAQLGVPARCNEAVRAAQADFLLFLAPGEALAPDALDVLSHYVSAFPACRALCARAVALGPDGQPQGSTTSALPPSELLARASEEDLAVAVRRDLFAELGGFDGRFAGAEAYDLALRAALREPLLSLPEALIGRGTSRARSRTGGPADRFRAARVAALRHVTEAAWPLSPAAPTPARAPIERGLCLVRTQGRRPALLARALASIAEQADPLTAAVIVHGDAAAFESVRRETPVGEGEVVFLHAADASRRRGYPWNVGLDYLAQHKDRFQYLTILDDDDIYYPLFTRRMVEALTFTGADVAYGLVNSRTPGGIAAASHMPLPSSCLAAGNFIPTNAYAVRTDLLLEAGIRAPEDMDYFEDWGVLVALLAAGARFHCVPEAVGEFLMIGDGNTLEKRDPAHHAWCLARMRAHGAEAARRLGLGRFYRDLLDFDFNDPLARHPSPGDHLILTKKQFLRAA